MGKMNCHVRLIVLTFSLMMPGQFEAAEPDFEFEAAPEYKSGEPFWHQGSRLHRAYSVRSKEQLDKFLHAWSNGSVARSARDLAQLPDAIRHAYGVFEDFYRPHELDRIGDAEWGPDQFKGVSYFVVQNSVEIVVSNSLAKSREFEQSSRESARYVLVVKNFRPKVRGSVPALFLTESYQQLVSDFLGTEELPLGHDGVMSTATAIDESKRRQEFLNTRLKIYHGHWGGWLLGTDPTVTAIQFNKDFTRAVVHFSLVYQGGEARYRRRGNVWILVKSELTWIT